MPYEELSVDVSEFEGFAQALEKLPLEVQDRLIKNATGAGATVLQVAAIQQAPVRVELKSLHSTSLAAGYVKADIRVAALKNGRGWLIGPSGITAYVVRWLEWGHQLVKGGKRGRSGSKTVNVGGNVIGHVPAKPFLRPAFDTSWKEAVSATARNLGAGIAQYWEQTLTRMKRAA